MYKAGAIPEGESLTLFTKSLPAFLARTQFGQVWRGFPSITLSVEEIEAQIAAVRDKEHSRL